MVSEASQRLGSQEAVCRWLGLNKGTLIYRRNHPHVIKQEHLMAMEALLNRVARASLVELEELLHKLNSGPPR